MGVRLTAELIEGFSNAYLAPRYDDAAPTPEFHRKGWALYCGDALEAGIAAPRGHAKSTAFTHAYILAAMLFRAEEYAILISTNEELAIEHLGDITLELVENEDLITDFEIKGFITNSKTEIVVEFKDGHQFRILARGSGQKLRGRKWHGARPGLIVCDDLEDDEQVENKDRRDKFRRWFFRAVLPCRRKGGKVRVHGTILHEASLLANLIKVDSWETLFYRAHASFDDFSEILWPEQFDEERLRKIRQGYIDQFDSNGYSQEYLNDPFDNTDAYLKKETFLPMLEADFEKDMRICVGVDFAISKRDRANRSSFTVGGQDANNYLNIIDQHVGRWGPEEIINELLQIQEMHDPYCFFVESGIIWSAIEPILKQEERRRGIFLNCVEIASVKDKATRGRSWQKRMKAESCRFNKQASWYAAYESECLRFTGYSESVLDDQFDSSAILSRGFDTLPLLDETDFMTDEELFQHTIEPTRNTGRSPTTGY